MENEYVLLESYTNYLLANMALGLLQENNIDCRLKDEYSVTIDPFLSPAIGGIKLLVEESALGRAKDLIHQAEADYLAETPCPHCKSHELVAVEKTISPTTLWGKLKNIAAYGQTDLYSKKFRCGNCKMVYDELPSLL